VRGDGLSCKLSGLFLLECTGGFCSDIGGGCLSTGIDAVVGKVVGLECKDLLLNIRLRCCIGLAGVSRIPENGHDGEVDGEGVD